MFVGNVPHTLVEVYFVQSKSLQQGTVIFPTPTYTRANGRISFNEAVAVKETAGVDHGKSLFPEFCKTLSGVVRVNYISRTRRTSTFW